MRINITIVNISALIKSHSTIMIINGTRSTSKAAAAAASQT